jgi:hypothetical protein
MAERAADDVDTDVEEGAGYEFPIHVTHSSTLSVTVYTKIHSAVPFGSGEWDKTRFEVGVSKTITAENPETLEDEQNNLILSVDCATSAMIDSTIARIREDIPQHNSGVYDN